MDNISGYGSKLDNAIESIKEELKITSVDESEYDNSSDISSEDELES